MVPKPVIETLDHAGITRVSRWIWNCYVIHEGPVVIDAGLPSAATDIAPIINDLGGSIHSIVATHGHSDHLAGAPAVADRYNAPILLPPRTLRYLAGEKPRNPGPIDQARVAPVLRNQPLDWTAALGLLTGTRCAGFGLSPRMRWTGPTPSGELDDGAPLMGAPAWSVVAAPGHTDDSIALWHPASGTLLSGDAVLTRSGRAWFTPELVDPHTAHQSNRRLRNLPVTTLLPGHGAPLSSDDVWQDCR
ncbi:MBL fold metallo-hydrolase [Tsukamurella sp. 8F]|uniref:MBL fold metallo-hydrolase n=1 Tax=unclassified Tsukamurella TaxID=2633480 RepID=UPI0023B8F071|nr:MULTISPECIES: MBL fold metallo-hydrolase [unclassified Tsukamurella]MDF0531818.1 MBL fold metallo-hydrolase [Tsukamurella sp. 8J]MDF0589060.1 MBL fold metallo-hydrolase [Tsukamurella sp. 8F]